LLAITCLLLGLRIRKIISKSTLFIELIDSLNDNVLFFFFFRLLTGGLTQASTNGGIDRVDRVHSSLIGFPGILTDRSLI
jgi:hypothetical protein